MRALAHTLSRTPAARAPGEPRLARSPCTVITAAVKRRTMVIERKGSGVCVVATHATTHQGHGAFSPHCLRQAVQRSPVHGPSWVLRITAVRAYPCMRLLHTFLQRHYQPNPTPLIIIIITPGS
jgi:hypothetical protein